MTNRVLLAGVAPFSWRNWRSYVGFFFLVGLVGLLSWAAGELCPKYMIPYVISTVWPLAVTLIVCIFVSRKIPNERINGTLDQILLTGRTWPEIVCAVWWPEARRGIVILLAALPVYCLWRFEYPYSVPGITSSLLLFKSLIAHQLLLFHNPGSFSPHFTDVARGVLEGVLSLVLDIARLCAAVYICTWLSVIAKTRNKIFLRVCFALILLLIGTLICEGVVVLNVLRALSLRVPGGFLEAIIFAAIVLAEVGVLYFWLPRTISRKILRRLDGFSFRHKNKRRPWAFCAGLGFVLVFGVLVSDLLAQYWNAGWSSYCFELDVSSAKMRYTHRILGVVVSECVENTEFSKLIAEYKLVIPSTPDYRFGWRKCRIVLGKSMSHGTFNSIAITVRQVPFLLEESRKTVEEKKECLLLVLEAMRKGDSEMIDRLMEQ
jgi:hypothetical protein